MTDPAAVPALTVPAEVAPTAAAPADTAAPVPPKKPGFAFTDPGCRSDVRIGALLILAAVFLWLWFGPATSAKIFLAGAPLILWGIPWQAFQARSGRPGYPWKLGLAMTALALPMCWDLRFREEPGAALQVQIIAPLLLGTGVWILLWWPVSRFNSRLFSRSMETAA